MRVKDFRSGGLSLVTKLSKNFVEGVSPSNFFFDEKSHLTFPFARSHKKFSSNSAIQFL